MKHVLTLALLSAAGSLAAEPIGKVAAVNAPLAYIAETLGGSALEVVYPVPVDVDPAYWTPMATDLQLFQTSDLILLNGAGYAAWTETHVLPRSRLVDTSEAVSDLLLLDAEKEVVHQHGPDGEHVHGDGYAITTWLDPDVARAQVDAAGRAITARWPELADSVAENLVALHDEITGMDADFETFFNAVADRQIIGSHPIYQYLDRAYPGSIDAVHWEPDKYPSEKEWSALSAKLDTARHPIMLWEGAPLPKVRSRLDQMNVEVLVLNPLGNQNPRNALFASLGAQVRR